jgi:hypothetical protein
MANTLTNLLPELYVNLDVVSRELVGLIPAVTIDATTNRAAKDQTVRSFVAPAATSRAITPGLYAPDDGNQTIGSTTLAISSLEAVPIRWNGEEIASLGPDFAAVRADQIQQAMRTLTNKIESDLAALYTKFSRAAGAAATTPFGTAGDYTAASLTRKILVDNGAPTSDLQLVIDTTAGANLRGKQASNAADPAGSTNLLRQGVLADLNGMMVRESAQIKTHTAGSFTSGTLTSAVRAVGTTVLAATADYTAGLGAGDIITLAHESGAHKYVIQSVAAGSITIAAPGLRTATAATGTVAITLIATSPRNMAFSKSAIVLATRLPYIPPGGDAATSRVTITDPRSGISFDLAEYRQYMQTHWELQCAWGVGVVKPEHTALLLG